MRIQEQQLSPVSPIGSGRVRRFSFPQSGRTITQITTYCPDIIGPGPIHTYLIEDRALILVDAGIPTNLAKVFFYNWRNQPMPPEIESLPPDYSEQELIGGIKLAGYSVADIDLLTISHGHPDHFLLGKAILNRSKARVAAHILDTPAICNPWSILSMWVSRQQQMVATGMPQPQVPKHLQTQDQMGGFDMDALGLTFKVDTPFLHNGPLTINGTPLADVQVLHLPGHSPGSVGLLVGETDGEKVLICGDVLLSPITPHPDDLLTYLQTLEELADYEDVELVLPAHGQAVRDLKTRVMFLKAHHRRRLELTYDACRIPRSVWDIASMPDYFDTYVDPGKFNFLAGLEALVHMEVLNMVGGLRRTHIRDAVHYFQNDGLPFEEIYGRITELVKSQGSRTLMRY